MKIISRKISMLFILGIILNIFLCIQVRAAEIFFGSTEKEVGVGQLVEVGVFVDTKGEQVNAFSGEIMVPTDVAEVAQFRDGNSIVNLWVEKPHIDQTTPGKIVFSGITPGGYSGDRGMLFSFIIQANKLGDITITSQHEEVLRSDGEGSAAMITRAPLTLVGTHASSSSFFPVHDVVPPEVFTPSIVQNNNAFDGKYFIVFATQDKGSGIAEYKISEEPQHFWNALIPHSHHFVSVQSPYVLQDQNLRSVIYVKAIDNSGNERIIVVPATHITWYEKYLIWCILGVIILLTVAIIFVRMYGGKKKKT